MIALEGQPPLVVSDFMSMQLEFPRGREGAACMWSLILFEFDVRVGRPSQVCIAIQSSIDPWIVWLFVTEFQPSRISPEAQPWSVRSKSRPFPVTRELSHGDGV